LNVQLALSSCQKCQILESRYHVDLRVYREALGKMELCAAERFQPAQIEAEFARAAFEDARAILNNHVAAHGCG
jgi:hypothetical protein